MISASQCCRVRKCDHKKVRDVLNRFSPSSVTASSSSRLFRFSARLHMLLFLLLLLLTLAPRMASARVVDGSVAAAPQPAFDAAGYGTRIPSTGAAAAPVGQSGWERENPPNSTTTPESRNQAAAQVREDAILDDSANAPAASQVEATLSVTEADGATQVKGEATVPLREKGEEDADKSISQNVNQVAVESEIPAQQPQEQQQQPQEQQQQEQQPQEQQQQPQEQPQQEQPQQEQLQEQQPQEQQPQEQQQQPQEQPQQEQPQQEQPQQEQQPQEQQQQPQEQLQEQQQQPQEQLQEQQQQPQELPQQEQQPQEQPQQEQQQQPQEQLQEQQPQEQQPQEQQPQEQQQQPQAQPQQEQQPQEQQQQPQESDSTFVKTKEANVVNVGQNLIAASPAAAAAASSRSPVAEAKELDSSSAAALNETEAENVEEDEAAVGHRSADQPTPASPPKTAEPIAPEVFSPSGDGEEDSDADAAATGEAADSFSWADEQTHDHAARGSDDSVRDRPTSHERLSHDALPTDIDDAEAEAGTDAPTMTYVPPSATITNVTELSHQRVSSPSREALSYLYYRALEALYIEENVSLFVHRARDAAPYGHARLNWLLGVLHAYGVGVPRSDRDALIYYSFAAMEGVPEAHMALGYRYRYGLGVRASCETALAHYREAADAVAMTYDGSAADLEGRATSELTGARTILSGGGGWHRGGGSSILSFLTYRDNVANSDQMRKAQRDLLKLIYQADLGSGKALLTLGYIYLKGSPQVRRDGRKAQAYLKQAAAKGIAEAHGALGNLYTSGDATIDPPLPRDLARAYHHYRLGALQKDAISLNGIGFLHAIGYLDHDAPRTAAGSGESHEGEGDHDGFDAVNTANPPDFATAAHYFERSRSPESTYNLAVLHLYGRGVAQDREKAQRLFWNAAIGGSVLARWQLAHLMDASLEQNPNECVKALELYREAASYGSWHRRDVSSSSGIGSSYTAADSQESLYNPGESHSGDGEADSQRDGDVDEKEASTTSSAYDHAKRDSQLRQPRGNVDENSEDYDGLSAPHSDADYMHLLRPILHRLQAVEESLRLSDSEDGPAMISLASFVELLSLAETGDAASTRLATQFADDYLTVRGESPEEEKAMMGDVTLLWPTSLSSTRAGHPSAYLHPAAARAELLYYLLQRTVLHPRQKSGAHGATYLRLGDFFYHGEAPQYGVDMARAMEYYRLAADVHHDPQALFNVGFMYQLGLHNAPRATLVSSADVPGARVKRPGTVWMIQSNPPRYVVRSPSLFLTAQAAAHAWNSESANPMSRAVDVYLAWRYYTASQRLGSQGWLAVRLAVISLNVQWSLRHFGFRSLLEQLPSSSAKTFLPGGGGDGDDVSAVPSGEDMNPAAALLEFLTAVAHAQMSFVYAVLSEMASSLAAWYGMAEQCALYGAVSVFVLALLVRHHAA